MPTIIDLEKYDKDPLDLIEKHKDIVEHIRRNGADGMEIRAMLRNSHGLKTELPLAVKKEAAAMQRQADYAMRYVKALVGNKCLTDAEKKALCKMYDRLWHEYPSWRVKGKSGNPVVKLKVGDGDGDAKTLKQMIGLRVAALNKYILPFNMMFLKNDIFDLIAELFEVYQDVKFSRTQIKNLEKNNC